MYTKLQASTSKIIPPINYNSISNSTFSWQGNFNFGRLQNLPIEIIDEILTHVAYSKNSTILDSLQNLFPMAQTNKSSLKLCQNLLVLNPLARFIQPKNIFTATYSELNARFIEIINVNLLTTKQKEAKKNLLNEWNLSTSNRAFNRFLQDILLSNNLDFSGVNYLSINNKLIDTSSDARHKNLFLLTSSATGQWLVQQAVIQEIFSKPLKSREHTVPIDTILQCCKIQALNKNIMQHFECFITILMLHININMNESSNNKIFTGKSFAQLLNLYFHANLNETTIQKYLTLLKNNNKIFTAILYQTILPLEQLSEHKLSQALEFIYAILCPNGTCVDENTINKQNIAHKISIILRLFNYDDWDIQILQNYINNILITADLLYINKFLLIYKPTKAFGNNQLSHSSLTGNMKKIIMFAKVTSSIQPPIAINLEQTFNKPEHIWKLHLITRTNASFGIDICENFQDFLNMNIEKLNILYKMITSKKIILGGCFLPISRLTIVQIETLQEKILALKIKYPNSNYILVKLSLELLHMPDEFRKIFIENFIQINYTNLNIMMKYIKVIYNICNQPLINDNSLNNFKANLTSILAILDLYINDIKILLTQFNKYGFHQVKDFLKVISPLLWYPANQKFIWENFDKIFNYPKTDINKIVQVAHVFNEIQQPLDLKFTLSRLRNLTNFTDTEINSILTFNTRLKEYRQNIEINPPQELEQRLSQLLAQYDNTDSMINIDIHLLRTKILSDIVEQKTRDFMQDFMQKYGLSTA